MNKVKYILFGLVVSVALIQTSCATKEYTDPSTISDTQISSTVDGLLGLCNGLQFRYTIGRQSPTYQGFSASGLLAGEQKLLNLGNTDEGALLSGGSSVTPSNSITTGLWTQSYLMLNEANRVLDNVNVSSNANIQAVFVSYGSIYKALAIGTLATYFERMPVTLGRNQPFVSREDALKQAVVLLENAEKSISSATVPADVTAKLVAGIDLKNTAIALQARYNLMLKDYPKALAAATKVNLAVKSGFRFDAVNTNPIFFNSFSNRNVLEPTNKALGLPAVLAPDTLDKRLPFYINPAASTIINLGFGL